MAVAMLSSKGAAGVTGSGFISLPRPCRWCPAIPVAGMALILGVDRFMSECRALTNFVGNAVATIVVARWEGALDLPRLRRGARRRWRRTEQCRKRPHPAAAKLGNQLAGVHDARAGRAPA